MKTSYKLGENICKPQNGAKVVSSTSSARKLDILKQKNESRHRLYTCQKN